MIDFFRCVCVCVSIRHRIMRKSGIYQQKKSGQKSKKIIKVLRIISFKYNKDIEIV